MRMQIRDRRLSEDVAVGWRAINTHFPRDSATPPMCTPVPSTHAPSHTRSHMTIEEVFETQRLRSELQKASDEEHAAQLTAFVNANIVPLIHELNEKRAQCGSLENQLKRARASMAGQVVSVRPSVFVAKLRSASLFLRTTLGSKLSPRTCQNCP